MSNKTESLDQFYEQKLRQYSLNLDAQKDHFAVFDLQQCFGPGVQPVEYSRRDFYKISLIRGRCRYHYSDKSIELDGSALIFFNPEIPYTWEPLSEDISGYFCIFSRTFFSHRSQGMLNDLPMYQLGGEPAYVLNEKQDQQVGDLFAKMFEEAESSYAFKDELIRNYIAEMNHYALKSKPAEMRYQHPDAKARITAVFKELLERQFPVQSADRPFSMRSPKDYADQLAVHVNYLNRAIKETTGKTTSDMISERLLMEAKILLRHTAWNISEVSYRLGFEEPSHFNNFFKKRVLSTPTDYRRTAQASAL